MTGVETITVLITDLVGSTGLESRVGPSTADRLRDEHFALIRAAVDATGGREVKNTGDGLMAVFDSATAGIACAVGVQQRFERRNRSAGEQLSIKVGLSLGDATAADRDYFGMPVIEAARLCDRATGGQILAKEVVAQLSGGRDGQAFRRLGGLELKGLPEPLPAVEVAWEPTAAGAGMPLPRRLQGVPEVSFVGRRPERERLEQAWADARQGSRRTVLLSGEPGIGKTRLASYAALAAHEQGGTVLYGRCDEDLGIAYQPWREAIRHLVAHAPDELLQAHVRAHGGVLARIVPELVARVGDSGAVPDSDPGADRYLLFTAVEALLAFASEQDPLMLVLDDLHWADRPSVQLLRHLLVAPEQSKLMVIGTFRESDLSREHPLPPLLADLHREAQVGRIRLDGLEEHEIVALLEAATGHAIEQPGRSLARQLHVETDGNPFFVGELLRHLVESEAVVQSSAGRWELRGGGEPLALPESIREVIGRRVARLGEETHRVLSAAAVIGRDFDVELLARVVERDPDSVLDLLEAAVAAAVLGERPDRPGWFSFQHALIEHTLYEELSPTRRTRTHGRVGKALEELGAGDRPQRLGELAHHYAAATRPADTSKAVEYASRAGRAALDALAPDEALRWFEKALELQGDHGDDAARCDALIGLGEARRQIGDPAFREALLEAGDLAQRLEDADRLARAALATNRSVSSSVGRPDDAIIELLEAALAALPQGDDPRRARVLAVLASNLTSIAPLERRREMCDEALAIARRLVDDPLLADVLQLHTWATWVPHTVDERVRHLAELLELVERLGDPVRLCLAHSRYPQVVERGDLEGMNRSIARTGELAARLGQPFIRWLHVITRCLAEQFAGRFADAEALAMEGAQIASEHELTDGYAVFGIQLSGIRHEQGRLGELLELIAQGVRDNPGLPGLRALYALALLDAGNDDQARTMLVDEARGAFTGVPLDQAWSTTLGLWCDIANVLEEPAAAAHLYDLLLPHADKIATNGIQIDGSIARPVGALATTLGRFEVADKHLRAAAQEHERLQAPVWLARTWVDQARLLMRSGEPVRARDLLDRAARLADAHGAAGVARAATTAAGA